MGEGLTADSIVSNINTITQKSQSLQAPAQSITVVNGPLMVVGQGPFPPLIAGFTDLISTATNAQAQMQGTGAIASGPDADSIFDAFRTLVRVHQQTLNMLIGKAGLFETVPFIGQPVSAILRQNENVFDSLGFTLVEIVESRASDIQSQSESLSSTITAAIDAYSKAN